MSLDQSSSLFYKHRAWAWPILAMLLITPFTPELDLAVTRHFYSAETAKFTTNSFFTFLYEYGPLPALITFILATIVLILSFFISSWSKWRKSALLLFLTYAIGSGLITHAILKDHWGRPRPKQVAEFGGTQPFRPYYSPNLFDQPQPSKSFPCGHCTTGFYFFALALAGKSERSRKVYWFGMATALALGILLSLTRIVQGGHFLSDTLISALVMWLTAYGLDQWIYRKNQDERVD